MEIQLESVIRCPKCGHMRQETMPSDFCLIRYQCAACGSILAPKQGDDCVFCSFGSVPCPSVQLKKGTEGEGI